MAGRIRGGWKEEREKERAGKHEGEEENSPDKRETPSLCKKCKTGRDQTQVNEAHRPTLLLVPD